MVREFNAKLYLVEELNTLNEKELALVENELIVELGDFGWRLWWPKVNGHKTQWIFIKQETRWWKLLFRRKLKSSKYLSTGVPIDPREW